MSRQSYYILIFLILLYLFRLFLIGFLQLVPDEAHYWYWAKYLQWSYYDHPPMVAWLMALVTWIGGDTEFFVRLGGFLCTVMTDFLLYGTVKTLYPKQHNLPWEALFVSNLTLLHAGGSIVQTPDTPQLLFWALALYSGAKVVMGGKARWWYVIGVGFGLGLLSKYSMVLLVPCLFAFLLLSRPHRHWLYRKEPYLAALLGLLIFSPVVWWNWQHHWVSFTFQLNQGFVPRADDTVKKLLDYIGGQAGLFTPLLFGAFIFYSLWGCYHARTHERPEYLYLALLSWPILLFFGLSTLLGASAEANWPAATYVAGGVLMWVVYRRHFSHRPGHRKYIAVSIGLALLMNLVLHTHLLRPFLPVHPKNDKSKHFHGWRELGQNLDGLVARHPSEAGHFLVASRGMASVAEAVFYTGNRFVGISFLKPQECEFLGDLTHLKGKDAIILIDDFNHDKIDFYLPFFQNVRIIGTNTFLYQGSRVPRLELHILLGEKFLGNWQAYLP